MSRDESNTSHEPLVGTTQHNVIFLQGGIRWDAEAGSQNRQR